jgi:hypothetical protein
MNIAVLKATTAAASNFVGMNLLFPLLMPGSVGRKCQE